MDLITLAMIGQLVALPDSPPPGAAFDAWNPEQTLAIRAGEQPLQVVRAGPRGERLQVIVRTSQTDAATMAVRLLLQRDEASVEYGTEARRYADNAYVVHVPGEVLSAFTESTGTFRLTAAGLTGEGWQMSPTVRQVVEVVPVAKASWSQRFWSLAPGTARSVVEAMLGAPDQIDGDIAVWHRGGRGGSHSVKFEADAVVSAHFMPGC